MSRIEQMQDLLHAKPNSSPDIQPYEVTTSQACFKFLMSLYDSNRGERLRIILDVEPETAKFVVEQLENLRLLPPNLAVYRPNRETLVNDVIFAMMYEGGFHTGIGTIASVIHLEDSYKVVSAFPDVLTSSTQDQSFSVQTYSVAGELQT